MPSFPSQEKPDPYRSIFAHATSLREPAKTSFVIKSRFPRDVKPPQKLEVLPLVAIKDPGLHFDEPLREDGLGKLPPTIKSVSSLLLFNTAQNPYSKHIGTDSLGGSGRSRRLAEPEPQAPSLDAAPASFMQLDGMGQKDDLSYIPGFGNVPEFDLPNTLPDLPGMNICLSQYETAEKRGGGALPPCSSCCLFSF